ncbi:hypothetical protein EVJ20_07505 [Exiguobacterium sp. SH0S1]|uniref:hypothetical protein n=1 Tax=Exiguobacterium sp. SH0S1 TaxID=2510949 RepID=UPI0010409182|nr:hypothetical protein [Exiguobacterium sp. SH0S1]TCI77798.1 hypothetical protein EVJ20_07505 [Exiguobacterium sp. SH0S1]
MRTINILPAIYNYNPNVGVKDKVRATEKGWAAVFELRPTSLDDKLYIQLFDQPFSLPPSKIYRDELFVRGEGNVRIKSSFQINSTEPHEFELFLLQYDERRKLDMDVRTLVQNGNTYDIEETFELRPETKFLKFAYRYILHDVKPVDVTLGHASIELF